MTTNEQKFYYWLAQAVTALGAGYPGTARNQLERAARFQDHPVVPHLLSICDSLSAAERGYIALCNDFGWSRVPHQAEPEKDRVNLGNVMMLAALFGVVGALIAALVPVLHRLAPNVMFWAQVAWAIGNTLWVIEGVRARRWAQVAQYGFFLALALLSLALWAMKGL